MKLSIFVCAALLATACKDDKPTGTAQAKAVADRGEVNPYIVKHAREDVVTVADKIAAKTATLYDCVVLNELKQIEQADAQLASKLKQVCAHDVPVFLIEQALAVAEPARKAKPDAITIEGCNVEAGLAIGELEKYGTLDDRARGLIQRLDAACPLMAQVRGDRAKRKPAAPAPKTH